MATGAGTNVFSSSQTPLKILKAPVSRPELLSTREKLILLNGSKLHGCRFWPWEKPPAAAEFEAIKDQEGPLALFEDPTPFRFSSEQLKFFDGWKRASAGENGGWHSSATSSEEDAGAAHRQESKVIVDLVQDITSDCSVVASLCAEIARAQRLGFACGAAGSTLSAIMYPSPQFGASHSGKYVFKLNFNGCFRKVEIDDRLPLSKTSRALHVLDRNSVDVKWPALIEKAYLKVRGGYDFPGSNSGTDLWVLTGWIPEQLFFQSDDILPSAFWKRIFNAFNYGDVLITIGTGKLSQQEENVMGLASEHAYAIIDMKEEDGERLLLVKNPWSGGSIWTGFKDSLSSSGAAEASLNHASKESMLPGTFWMDINSVFQHFETVYLNWNPGLFSHRRDIHFSWDMKSRSPYNSFANNPQYMLRSEGATTVWVLLTKHFQNFSREEGGEAGPGNDPRLQTGFLSLYVFDREHRVILTDGAINRSPYVDAPNVLLRFEMPPRSTYVIVASEQNMPASKLDFTLSAFTTKPLSEFRAATPRYSHCISQTGAWRYTTAGGNGNSPQYHLNPQFKLDLPVASDLSLVLEAENEDYAINVKLMWTSGKRIPAKITSRDVYGDSGEYRRGCAVADVPNVLAGTYTIVCSTFKQGEQGNFTLRLWSMSERCAIESVPVAEQPGVFTLQLQPAVFVQGVDRVLAPIQVSCLTRLSACAKWSQQRSETTIPSSSSSSGSPLRISLEYGQGPNSISLATTAGGEFTDASAAGLQTTEVDVKPHMCDYTRGNGPGVWLVLERMGGSSLHGPEDVEVEILSDEQGVGVGLWGKASDEPIEELQRKLARSSF